MKKITIFLTALLMLTACSNETGENNAADVLTDTTTIAVSTENPDDLTDTTITSAAEKNWGEPDFRNVNWGMSKDEVITIEGTPDRERAGDKMYYYLGYDVFFSDYETELEYWFENGALVQAKYHFECDDKTDLQLNTMYFKVLDEYTSEYGSPDKSIHSIWDSDLDESEYPYISDPDFEFGNTVLYRDRWFNANGAVIDLSMTYSAPTEEDDESAGFLIEHIAIGDNTFYNILASVSDDIDPPPPA